MEDDIDDPFRMDSTYDRDRFYTASRNKKGFGTTVRVLLPPELLAQIGLMTQSNSFPELRTQADFLRDAIVHNLHRLAEIAKRKDYYDSELYMQAASREHVRAQIDMIANRSEDLDLMIKKCRDAIHYSDDRERTKKELMELIESFPDASGRERLRKELR